MSLCCTLIFRCLPPSLRVHLYRSSGLQLACALGCLPPVPPSLLLSPSLGFFPVVLAHRYCSDDDRTDTRGRHEGSGSNMVNAMTTIASQQRQRCPGDFRASAIAAAAGTPSTPDGGASIIAWGGGDVLTHTVHLSAGAGVYPTLSRTGDVKPSNPEATVKARGLTFTSESPRARTEQRTDGTAGSIGDSDSDVVVSGCRDPRSRGFSPSGRDSATEAGTQRASGEQQGAECYSTRFSSAADEEDIGPLPISISTPPSRFGRSGLAPSSARQHVRGHLSYDEDCPRIHSLDIGEYDSDSDLSEGNSEVRGARGVSSVGCVGERTAHACTSIVLGPPL